MGCIHTVQPAPPLLASWLLACLVVLMAALAGLLGGIIPPPEDAAPMEPAGQAPTAAAATAAAATVLSGETGAVGSSPSAPHALPGPQPPAGGPPRAVTARPPATRLPPATQALPPRPAAVAAAGAAGWAAAVRAADLAFAEGDFERTVSALQACCTAGGGGGGQQQVEVQWRLARWASESSETMADGDPEMLARFTFGVQRAAAAVALDPANGKGAWSRTPIWETSCF